MAKKGRIIPNTRLPFDAYIHSTDDYLLAIDDVMNIPNWQRLGLSSSNKSKWHNKRVAWDNLFIEYHYHPTNFPN